MVVDEFEFFGLRYSGVVLWSCDCLVQAALVMIYANWKPTKLLSGSVMTGMPGNGGMHGNPDPCRILQEIISKEYDEYEHI